jgi:hypothetical protein
MMEVIRSSETSVLTRATRRNVFIVVMGLEKLQEHGYSLPSVIPYHDNVIG